MLPKKSMNMLDLPNLVDFLALAIFEPKGNIFEFSYILHFQIISFFLANISRDLVFLVYLCVN